MEKTMTEGLEDLDSNVIFNTNQLSGRQSKERKAVQALDPVWVTLELDVPVA